MSENDFRSQKPGDSSDEITARFFRHNFELVATAFPELKKMIGSPPQVSHAQILTAVGQMFESLGRRAVLGFDIIGERGVINTERHSHIVAITAPLGLYSVELLIATMKSNRQKMIAVFDSLGPSYDAPPPPEDFALVKRCLDFRAVIAFRRIGIEAVIGESAALGIRSPALLKEIQTFDKDLRTETRMAALVAFNVVRKPYLDLIPPGPHRDAFFFVTLDADLDPSNSVFIEQLLTERFAARQVIGQLYASLEQATQMEPTAAFSLPDPHVLAHQIWSDIRHGAFSLMDGIDRIFQLALNYPSLDLLLSVGTQAASAPKKEQKKIPFAIFGIYNESLEITAWLHDDELRVDWEGLPQVDDLQIRVCLIQGNRIIDKYDGFLGNGERDSKIFTSEMLGFDPREGELRLIVYPGSGSDKNEE